MMMQKRIGYLMALLVLVVTVAGCVGQEGGGATTTTTAEDIKSADEAGSAIKDLTEEVGNIGDDLSKIDSSLK